MSTDRALRILTLFTSALATPLLIGCTIASLEHTYWYRRRVTTFCFAFIPLTLTALASIVGLRRQGRKSSLVVFLLDLGTAITYLAILIPIWAVEMQYLHQVGLGLLVGYTTAPMIVNMLFHIYAFWWTAKYAVPEIITKVFSKTEHECPNCRSKFTVEPPRAEQISNGGAGYSLLRGEDYLDEDATAYNDARTSEEQVGVEGAADVEGPEGKGAIKL